MNKMASIPWGVLALIGLVSAINCLENNVNLPAESKFLKDLQELSQFQADGSKQTFSEESVGFDQHADTFYYNDKFVSEAFKRLKYKSTKVTMGGQQPDLTGRTVKAALNPFAIGQRSLNSLFTSSARWDIKDNGRDVQIFAIYHGFGSDFTVNKLRAHLLRYLANRFQNYVPILERCVQPDAKAFSDQVDNVYDEVKQAIEDEFIQIDETIRGQLATNDDSSATATVTIVTRSHIITANVGNGRVLAYDNNYKRHVLTPEFDEPTLNNVFGAKKSRPASQKLRAHVDIYLREAQADVGAQTASYPTANSFDEDGDRASDHNVEVQFIIMESPGVARFVYDKEAVDTALSQFNEHKDILAHEQQIYSETVDRILNIVSRRSTLVDWLKHPDHVVALIGLERNYNNIH